MFGVVRKSCPGCVRNEEDEELSCGACAGLLYARARLFLFHIAVFEKGSGLAGGLPLPVQVGLNLACHRQFSLILAVLLPNYQVELVCVLLVLLRRGSCQDVPQGVRWDPDGKGSSLGALQRQQ